MNLAGGAPKRSSQAAFASSAAPYGEPNPRSFLSRLRANLVPQGTNVKSFVIVLVAMVAGVALAGAVIPLVFLGLWLWLVVAIVRTVRGDAKQARAAFREGRGLDLSATEAHGDAPAPSTFGRRVAMALGLIVVTMILFGAISRQRTVVEQIEVPRTARVSVVESAASNAVASSSRTSEITGGESRVAAGIDSVAESSRFTNRRLGVTWLAVLVAVGAAVGLAVAVGRKKQAIDSDARKRLDATQLPKRPTLRGLAVDVTGSVLLMFAAVIVVNRMLLVVLVDQLGATTYLWTTATTFTAAALTAAAIKAVRFVDRDSSGRRLMFFAVGIAVGAASWIFAEYLGFAIPFDVRWAGIRAGVRTSSWPECYVDGVPTVLAFMGYYGLSFLAIDWWAMTTAKRGSRWRIGDVFVAVFWAGAVHFVFPFPQPWGVLTAAGTALVLPFAFPLPPQRKNRAAQMRYGGQYI